MKKIGLLIIAVVLATGGLGVGYAMWSDTITINGTVNTGNVDLVVKEYSSTYVWKLEDHGLLVTTDDDPPADAIDWNDTGEVTPVAYAKAEQDGDDKDAIKVTIDNAFPVEVPAGSGNYVPIKADFLLHYEGSIPVRVQVAELKAEPDLSPFLKIRYYNGVEEGGQIIRGAEIKEAAIMGDQWHYCKYVWVDIYFDGELLQNADWEGRNAQGQMGGMSLDAEITGKIMVVQWNEYVDED